MLLSGIQKFSVLDYPEKVACIVFTPGCDFRCGFCHNSEFVLPEKIKQLRSSFIEEKIFFNFLRKRKNLLDGVVITGGEPTMQRDLLDFMRKIKELGFLVKLDSNGVRPKILEKVINSKIVDYIAMDIKSGLEEYADLVGVKVKKEDISASIELLKENRVPYEFRTTLIKELHTDEILLKMKELLKGAKQYFLQTFRPQNTLNPLFEKYHSYSTEEMLNIAKEFSKVVEKVAVR